MFALVVGVALLVTASTSTTAFGAYNTAWDGTSDLRTLATTTDGDTYIAQNTSAYTQSPPNATVALILAPEQSYGSSDTQRIAQFVRNGGTLVVADDRAPTTNAVLTAIGADARIDGSPLRDTRAYYQSPAAPIVRNISTHPVLANVSALTLNHGSAVRPNTATVLARTSGYAYRDTNQNQELDQTETVTEYPIMTVESLGQGRVIVVSDPSIFINTMLSQTDNRQLARNLFESHPHVIIDYSHTVTLPPLMQFLLVVRGTPLLQTLLGGIGVVLLAVTSHRTIVASLRHRLAGRTKPPSSTIISQSDTEGGDDSPITDAALVEHLRKQYPEWEEDRLNRIVEARRTLREQDVSTDSLDDRT